MRGHTPGPWRWVYAYQCRGTHWCLENDEHARRGLTIDHRLVTLGTEEYDYDDDGNATRLDQTPNFLLIAAAPDLLAACEAAADSCSGCSGKGAYAWVAITGELVDIPCPRCSQLRAAIAKAQGGREEETG